MSGSFIVVVGATSEIARAIERELARPGVRLLLVGRDAGELEACAQDLHIRMEVEVLTRPFEALAFAEHPRWAAEWCELAGGAPDGVLVCHGYLPDSDLAARDPVEARRTLDVNLTSVVSILTPLAEQMAARGSGWIAVISSVAGDRGRRGNPLYGAAKAGLSVYLQGLRSRLAPRGVHVLTVKPGFVDTRMLRSRDRATRLLAASPERVARSVRRGLARRRNTIYTPWFWRPIMWLVRSVPEAVFKRMNL